MPSACTEDLTGQEYGLLTALRFLGSDPVNGRMWECRCACGVVKPVRGSCLRGGQTRSCGCYKKPRGTNLDEAPSDREGFTFHAEDRFATALNLCRQAVAVPTLEHLTRAEVAAQCCGWRVLAQRLGSAAAAARFRRRSDFLAYHHAAQTELQRLEGSAL